jgi:4-hydroxy-tetrahydrodipicolinate synthase
MWLTNVTPYQADGSIDYALYREHVSWLAAAGVERHVPAGNTGEYSSLSVQEVLDLTEATREAAPDIFVLTGVGGAIGPTIELATEALARGADAVMLHHPTHTHVSSDGLGDYCRRIAEATEGRTILYKRDNRLGDELILELLREEAALGVKYAVNDLIAFKQAQAALPGATWLCGTAELWAPFFHLLGAVGFTSGLANAAPAAGLAMEQALASDDIVAAMDVREHVRDIEELRQGDSFAYNVPTVRSLMALAGFDIGPARPPLGGLDAAGAKRVERAWQAWAVAGLATSARAAV